MSSVLFLCKLDMIRIEYVLVLDDFRLRESHSEKLIGNMFNASRLVDSN